MPRGYRDYEESLKKRLKDRDEAARYLDACLEAGSPDVFLLALRQVATAHGIGRIENRGALVRAALCEVLARRRFKELMRKHAGRLPFAGLGE